MKNNSAIQLSINYGGHDTSAALSINRKIVSANEQERFDLLKHSRKFPLAAISSCLRSQNLDINNVDRLIITTDFNKAKILKKRVRDKKKK